MSDIAVPTGEPRLQAVFVFNLVQDVNVLRPLTILAARDFDCDVRFLITTKFIGRDISGIWQNELDLLAVETGAKSLVFEHEFEALAALDGHGLLFAGSESNLGGHAPAHDVMRMAPASYLCITLQHGFECVGFRHSAAHKLSHGPDASFAADAICSWLSEEDLAACTPSQRGKIVLTGPSAVLQQYRESFTPDPAAPGIVCENLHSVRMNGMGDLKSEFVDVFAAFCAEMAADETGSLVALRPHPGGQYVVRNNVPIPANVVLENAPIYRLDLRRFAYGISAPSSVLLDMVLAGIPTAVWRDGAGRMDTDNYADLPGISSVDEWCAFARKARAEPESFEAGRKAFLDRFGLPIEAHDVYARYSQIFEHGRRNAAALAAAAKSGGLRFQPSAPDAA